MSNENSEQGNKKQKTKLTPEDILKGNNGQARHTGYVNRLSFWHNDMEAVIAIVAVLIILGSINVFSSSFVMAESDQGTPYYYLIRHVVIMILSLPVAYLCYRIDYRKYGNYIPVIALGLLAALVLVLLIGEPVKGAQRWLGYGPAKFQPAEFAKLCSIIIMAKFLEYRIKIGKKATIFSRMTAFLLLIAFLIEKEPDLGTAAISFGIPVLMMLIVGLPWRQVAVTISFLSAAAAIFVWIQPYRLERIMVWIDPFADAQDVGFQIVRSLMAIGSGGIWGMGLGEGVSKYYYLPEAHTDFAFAVFSQENGFLMVLLVFALFGMLAFHMVRIARSACDIYGHILAMGIMLLIVGQAVFNMLMVSGVLPVIGVPLPFISYGGSSLTVTLMAVGILLNIAKQGEDIKKEKHRKQIEMERAARPKRRPLLRLIKQ